MALNSDDKIAFGKVTVWLPEVPTRETESNREL